MSWCEPVNKLSNMDSVKMHEYILIKRDNARINEIVKKSQENGNIPNLYGDRFIPRRYNGFLLDFPKNHRKIMSCDFLQLKKKIGYWRLHYFLVNLNTIMDMKNEQTLLLYDLTNQLICQKQLNNDPKLFLNETSIKNIEELDWPCTPRKKPLAFVESSHDMPGFNLSCSPNVIGWSSQGSIAAAFGGDLVVWMPLSENTVIYKTTHITALAFDPKGDFLVTGTEKNDKTAIELWGLTAAPDISWESKVFKAPFGKITVLTWHSQGKHIICGTSTGEITVHRSPGLKVLFKLENAHKGMVLGAKFSPDKSFLVTADSKGKVVIWLWKNLQMHSTWTGNKGQAFIDWHPWCGSELVIAESTPSSIALIDVRKKKILSLYSRKDKTSKISSISFNKISGELVVSYSFKDAEVTKRTEILVFASMNRVVDVLISHEDYVRCLIWSPDNTQLATVGNDDSLTIWNFFAKSQKILIDYNQKSKNNEVFGLNKKRIGFQSNTIR